MKCDVGHLVRGSRESPHITLEDEMKSERKTFRGERQHEVLHTKKDFLFIEDHVMHEANNSQSNSFIPRVDSFEVSGEADSASELKSKRCELVHYQQAVSESFPIDDKDDDERKRALACIGELGSVIGDLIPLGFNDIANQACEIVVDTRKNKKPDPCRSSSKPHQMKKSPSMRRSIFSNLVHQNSLSQSKTAFVPEESLLAWPTIQLERCGSAPVLLHRTHMPTKPALKRVASESTANAMASSSDLKRSVSFSKLEIREFNIALSDHPSCSYGPPIQLGWDYRDQEAVEVDLYENGRLPRRRRHQMVLSYHVRRYLLLQQAGCTLREIQHAMNEVNRVKRERKITDILMPVRKIDERREEVMNRIKNIFIREQAPICKSS